ncbi:peptidoglycan-binding protein [Actinocorallia populi]|uniref:peptidoglycan-binding protein n=1 Tax=Actinocorallia populi TaxID=2079200 RepID=UPI000D0895EF|nr:peptidoglycan-binding protein [Actinocorallia populi]
MDTHIPATGEETAAAAREEERAPRRRRRPRWRFLGGGLVVAAAVAVGAAALNGGSFGGEEPVASAVGADTATAEVRRGPLSAQVNTHGTLTYKARPDGSPHTAINKAAGSYTRLPSAGDVIRCGKRLYTVDDDPVALLCANRPFYRSLSQGDYGWDVRQLNNGLLELGYADEGEIDEDANYFGYRTELALEEFQDDVGAEVTGVLEVGDVVALPGPLRVSGTLVKAGTAAVPDAPVLEATGTGRQVTVALSASQQTGVEVGDKVQITLPSNKTTKGKVTRIGAVARSTAGNEDEQTSQSGASNAELPVHIELDEPEDAGGLDEAPVQVEITVDGVEDALTVPVTAIVGVAGNGYAVERVGPSGAKEMVPVTLGLFDDAGGVVQVEGGLAPGDRVVVPAS